MNLSKIINFIGDNNSSKTLLTRLEELLGRRPFGKVWAKKMSLSGQSQLTFLLISFHNFF